MKRQKSTRGAGPRFGPQNGLLKPKQRARRTTGGRQTGADPNGNNEQAERTPAEERWTAAEEADFRRAVDNPRS